MALLLMEGDCTWLTGRAQTVLGLFDAAKYVYNEYIPNSTD